MKELGNERSNAIWEARVSDFHVGKPNESADRQAKEMFITAKYPFSLSSSYLLFVYFRSSL